MFKHIIPAACLVACLATGAAAHQEAVSFELTNKTRYTLTHIYISVPSSNSWEEDILGNQVVESGETVVITVDDGLDDCKYDIRYDFNDGDSLIENAVDLCEINVTEYEIS